MIAVLGGGISGLTVAYQLKKLNKPFLLFEADDHLGGKVGSFKEAGFTCELGPNTVLVNNPEIKSLLQDLGLWDDIIFPDEIAIKSRFVLKNNKIEAIPTSLRTAVSSKLFSLKTVFSLLKELKVPAKNDDKEESLAAFSRRRFGAQIFDDFITPFITGIYAGDPEKMSMSYTLSIMKEAEKEHGSVIKGMMKKMKLKKLENEAAGLPKQKVFSFKNGLQDLIDKLSNEISDAAKVNTRIKKISSTEGGYSISYLESNKEKTLTVDAIVSALPSFSLSDVLKLEAPNLSSKLKRVNYTNAVVVHLGFNKKDLSFNKTAFGILSRKVEKVPFLGILFNSRFFPHTSKNKDQELITVICGGSRYPELVHKPDNEIEEEVIDSLTEVLGLKAAPLFSKVTKWKNGIPQYELGYAQVEKEIVSFQEKNSNFYLLGNYYKGISVSDCIKNAIHLGKKIS